MLVWVFKSMTTILMIDDDELLLELYSAALSDNFHVLFARTVAEAIELLATEKIDAVGCDYHLSNDELGLDVIAWISTHCTDLLAKTMLISGELSPPMQGFNVQCLYKPVAISELLGVFHAWSTTTEELK